MISFRFHLVSLVAVFLALGLGVLSGTTVINRGIVSQLEERTDELAADFESQRAQLTRMEAELDGWNAFGEAAKPWLVEDRLAQAGVVIVTQEGTDEEAIDGVRTGLEDGRARILALLEFDEAMALQTDAERQALAQALGLDGEEDAEQLQAEAARLLADRLTVDAATGGDALQRLIDAGFVTNSGPQPVEDADLSTADAVVVVGGGVADTGLEPSALLVPLVQALAQGDAAVVATEAVDAVQPFVEPLRDDGNLDGRIVTQDNVDQVPGQIGLVLGLDDLLLGQAGGNYGVKDGASSVIPVP